jgi:UDP-N-acetylglucosamine 1-carboxyvinyltransferase
LHGAEHRIIPDRIEAGTFAIAAAITGGDLEIEDCCPSHLEEILLQLRETGVQITQTDATTLRVERARQLQAVSVSTKVYPGFATDMQAQYMALMTQANGDCEVTDTIFENRFMHASELQRLGANVRTQGRSAFLKGPSRLTGARIMASDLRASASLFLAGLVADGETIIERVYHIDRDTNVLKRSFAELEQRSRG